MFKIFFAFLLRKKKKFLSKISECFNISAYPHIISLFGKVFKKLVSVKTKLG